MSNQLSVYWLNPPQNTQAIYPDIGWMNFSTYTSYHNWIQPIIDWEKYTTLEQIVQHIVSSKPDVLCLSTYVWNYRLCYAVVVEVKKQLPATVVLQGGPHQGYSDTFFSDHPYVDYACYATGHGEYFIEAVLQQIADHGYVAQPEKVPYIISRTYCDPTTTRKYVYPDEIPIEHNMAYALNCAEVASLRDVPLTLMVETTRGCPYSCTYCEWGGGTSSKVSAKSLDIVKRELDLVGTLGFQHVDIIDANFGILDRDVEIAKYLAHVRRSTGFPSKVVLYGVAKTSVLKRERILDVMYQNGLMSDYFIAFQSVNPVALQAVKRTDITIEENKELAHKIIEKYNARAHVELVMGLPGSTIGDFYAEMDLYHEFYAGRDPSGWLKARNVFTLLPDSPAAKPGYAALHGIKSVSVGMMDGDEAVHAHSSKSVIASYRGSAHVVVQTNTYTVEQWKDMFLLNRIQRTVGPLLRTKTKASTFFRDLLAAMKDDPYFEYLDNHTRKLVAGELHGVDLICLEGMRIEDHVMTHYVIPNAGRFADSLDITRMPV